MKRLFKIAPVFTVFLLFFSTDSYAVNHMTSSFMFRTETNTFERISEMSMQEMFLLSDTALLESAGNVSNEIDSLKVGETVSVISVSGENCEVLTDNGKLGFININKLTSKEEYVFNELCDLTKYVKADTKLLTLPDENASVAMTLKENENVTLTGSNKFNYWRVEYNGSTYYVNKDNLSDTKIRQIVNNVNWNGRKLTKSAGTIIGPSGKETYYNLNMKGVVSIMRGMGNKDEYWIRSDGVKMLGDYVMVAAHLGIRPRGSLVPTSLGMGIVCDTGTFANRNKTQLDIAVAW